MPKQNGVKSQKKKMRRACIPKKKKKNQGRWGVRVKTWNVY